MNIYKNLMFLHGHFVDPRDADDDSDDGAQGSARTAPTVADAKAATRKVIAGKALPQVAAAPASHRAQTARPGVITGWRAWLRLWPSETAKVEVECGARGCV